MYVRVGVQARARGVQARASVQVVQVGVQARARVRASGRETRTMHTVIATVITI